MTLEQTTELYASVLRQLLPVGGYDNSPSTTLAIDVYAHAKLLAQADLDAKRLLGILEAIPPELIDEYEAEYGLPLKCTVNASRTVEERLQILNWVRTSRNVLNRAYLEQLLAIFGVVLIDVVKFKPMLCTAACDSPVNTEQLRYKVFLRLQYPMNADMNCIIENYLSGYLRIEWMVDMPWGDWILNPGVTVNTTGIAHYTAYKTNQREYYDSNAELDLTEAIVRSLHDANMQQWQAVKDACSALTSGKTWTFDTNNEVIKYINSSLSDDCSGSKCPTSEYVWYGRDTLKTIAYFTEITKAESVCQTIKPVGAAEYRYLNSFDVISFNCAYGGNKGSSYWSRQENNAYDPSALPNETRLTFGEIAQKIISNIQNSNQAISLLAETYAEAVANSIFSTDESKQFVKLTDLFSQLELNKTLRT
ncbi:hypothetical protein SFB21_3135 [Acinetobacter bouvetii]|uniref:DUF2313 domain-containing protein n=1 Tax=Acinetobacter bouvetii TaxID=202951 RepID=A0A811GE18_9GAMM|nr:hypothetical protein SFB21_3135 [Acinetobacter bouvetii]